MFASHRRLLLIWVLSVTAVADEEQDERIRRATVRIIATQRPPDYLRPWMRDSGAQSQGSGVVIEGERILTNAHVVEHAAQLYVQPYQSSQTYPATIEGYGPGVDLAVLKIQNGEFFKDRAPVKLAPQLPQMNADVTMHGYVIGGSSLATTTATVARIEFGSRLTTDHSLSIQLGGAVNPGNSGGAAVVDGEMIGLVLGFHPEAQNVGYVIPNDEINAFIESLASQPRPTSGPTIYKGKVSLGAFVQALENPALRMRMGLADGTTGVLVRSLIGPASQDGLMKDDILTHIGPHAIDNVGSVRLRNDLTLSFYYLVSKLARDGTIRLSVLRAGKKLDLDVPVTTDSDYVMRPLHGALPKYLICGPIVFSTASQELVTGLTPYAASMWTAQSSPLLLRQSDLVRFEGEELVLMTAMLPHPLTQGYSATIGRVVSQVNGVQIRNLRHLAETLRDSQERFIEIEFAERFVEELVFERQAVLDAMDEILADNGIRHPCSAELRDVWNPGN